MKMLARFNFLSGVIESNFHALMLGYVYIELSNSCINDTGFTPTLVICFYIVFNLLAFLCISVVTCTYGGFYYCNLCNKLDVLVRVFYPVYSRANTGYSLLFDENSVEGFHVNFMTKNESMCVKAYSSGPRMKLFSWAESQDFLQKVLVTSLWPVRLMSYALGVVD